jgi:hypothetical protein
LSLRPNRMFIANAINGNSGIRCAYFTISACSSFQ